MSLLMKNKAEILGSSADRQAIGDRLETMSRVIGDFFLYKLHQESLASGRPMMGVGHHEVFDSEKRKVTFVRTFPFSRQFENRVTIAEPDQGENPDLAEPEDYRWQAAVPREDVSNFIGRDMSELVTAVEVLKQEHERLLAE
jgi:hypothetical protein